MSETDPSISGDPVAPKTCGLAVGSLLMGILSLVACFSVVILAAIPAVICGHLALKRIKDSGGILAGRGLAIAGLVAGYVGVVGLLLALVIPRFVHPHTSASPNACVNNLRAIDGAKQQWALENKKHATDTPTAEDVRPYLGRGTNYEFPVCPGGGVYTIGAVGEKPTCSIPGHVLP